mmetsp:Transcript_40111/g.65795  ORF Transcript_40111/g.65795 Transcript_40111/m.65795 type:complete len:186 (-) Transcript_40111:752-1309(-)|eukprot:CAMPEP_0202696700 /NCGR_PEP_ID=MMETSP1385-20130828/10013_1 /ASSEMBLY_ACC=CAM_ASM_000861 /TAXON_ID=933848 /ORGANISM="Elphidium margaritaceum" /LENGTH=185 /DNA_ID=CAMNT_0049352945 /DNA_START=35 /DNA_END=592 /DNA_ORIENTATION=-
MGVIWTQVIDALFGKQEAGVLMIGLDAAGKTTILYKLKLGEVVQTIPTIGFNVETVEYKNLSFTVFDVGGQDKIRPLWKHYYENADAIIFVVDSNDRNRIDTETNSAKAELDLLLEQPQLRDVPLLVFANKQDLKSALSAAELAHRLQLNRLKRKWKIQGTVATRADGLYEGLDWLARTLQEGDE